MARARSSLRVNAPLAPTFSARAADASEVEIKFLVPKKYTTAFTDIETYFASQGMIHSSQNNRRLITRQLDTENLSLLNRGASARIRGTCLDPEAGLVITPDICIKTGKSRDESGAVRRGEYETRIPDFDRATFNELFQKYPSYAYPELHDALKGIDETALKEYFRIDCMRTRHVIELPEAMHGMAGKKTCFELICDDVCFVLDVPGLEEPLTFAWDSEIECEILHKPCSYDDSPNAARHVSSKLTKEEANRALYVMRQQLMKATDDRLVMHYDSKAERGFNALAKMERHFDKMGITKSSRPSIVLSHCFEIATPLAWPVLSSAAPPDRVIARLAPALVN